MTRRPRKEGPGREASTLRHEVALVSPGDREVRAPRLQEECDGDPDHPLAKEVIAASRAGNLRCPVCGGTVERVFPPPESVRQRWHFRRRSGSGECDHEGESIPHRDTKISLADALKVTLPESWTVLLEHRLENRRQPDVLAVHENGSRVAFEVQYANISRSAWLRRHRDYAAIGVRVYWLLGAETRWGRSRDDLRSAVETPGNGQRVIYVGRFGAPDGPPDGPDGGGPIEARELVFSYLSGGRAAGGHRLLASASGLPPEQRRGTAARGRTLSYGLREIGLLEDGTLVTPVDLWNATKEREERRLAAEEERREREEAERIRAVAEAERAVLAAWEREEALWLGSKARGRAVAELGASVVEGLESEVRIGGDRPVRGIPRTGWWRVGFYLGCVGRRTPGHPFAWSDVLDAYLARFEARENRSAFLRPPERESHAWVDLREHLEAEGLLVRLDRDHWTVPNRPNEVEQTEPHPTPIEDESGNWPGVSAHGSVPGETPWRRLRRRIGGWLRG